MKNSERLKNTPLSDTLLKCNVQIGQRNGNAECVLQCFMSKFAAALRCEHYPACWRCIEHWLEEEEDP